MSRARRVASFVLGGGLLLLATGAFAARYVDIPGHRTLYAVIASPFLAFAAPLALLVLLWGRRWVMAVAAGVLAATLLAVQLPWYVSAAPAPGARPLRAMTVNMLFGKADPRALAEAAAEQADVVMVQELTPEAVEGLADAGIGEDFPHQALDARPAAAGVGIYSRFPIADDTRIPGYALAMVKTTLHIDGLGYQPTFMSVHFAAPWPMPINGWHNDFGKFPATLADVAAETGTDAVVIGGDFNATVDMRPFRELLTDGYRDAADQAGSGRELTYPSNSRIPPFMGIDHVITRNCSAIATQTLALPGTDHRALIATIMLPRRAS